MSKKIPTSLYLWPAPLPGAEDLCFGLLAVVSLSAVALAFNQTRGGAFSGNPSMVGQASDIVQHESTLLARGIE
jgi:hypothetical protein